MRKSTSYDPRPAIVFLGPPGTFTARERVVATRIRNGMRGGTLYVHREYNSAGLPTVRYSGRHAGGSPEPFMLCALALICDKCANYLANWGNGADYSQT